MLGFQSIVSLMVALLVLPGPSSSFVPSTSSSTQDPAYFSFDVLQTSLDGRRGKRQTRFKNSDKGQTQAEADHHCDDQEIDYSSNYTVNRQQQQQLNRRERMEIILKTYGKQCIWCQCSLDVDSATTDHIIPRIKGGPSWIENELASCKKCNKARGHTSVIDWIEICRQGKGYEPDEAAVLKVLLELEHAIEVRGGQRKARPYLARQLRLLGKDAIQTQA